MGLMLIMGPTDEYDKAASKAKDPKMTTENNPLFTGRKTAEDMIARKNMQRLEDDACRRSCPVHGAVYEGFMSTRFKGEE